MSSPKRSLLRVLSVLALALVASPALAWSAIDSSQPVWSGTVPYSMQSAGSADLGADMTETIVQQAMGDWTMVSCTDLTASYGGRTGTGARTGDGTSVIGWSEGTWRYDSSAIGVTQPQWSVGGGGSRIQEADMDMNGVNFTWITGSGTGSRVNAYSIVLHEGGHFYGLGHSSSASATMYYAYSGGIDSLGTDDQNGICTLYPNGSTPTDCRTTGCSSGLTCQPDGTCARPMTGDGGMCASCADGSECTMGVCLQYPDGQGYCGTNCSSSSDCASGDMCFAVSGVGGQCVRVVGSMPSCAGSTPTGCMSDSDCGATETCDVGSGDCIPRPAGGALGAGCSAASDCSSGICLGGSCSQTCNWLDPLGGCGAGYYCNGQATGTCDGTGLCQAGTPGGGAFGASCSSNIECAGLFCAGGVCSTPCIPGGASACAEGSACQVLSTASCGSCQQTGQLGDPCALETDCASRICVDVNGDRRCSSLCDPASDTCGAGYTCMVATGGTGVCVGDSGGLGASCASADDCITHICASEPGNSYCTRECTSSSPCQVGYSCVQSATEGTRVCAPRAQGGCGCAVVGSRDVSVAGGALLAAALGLLVARSRRRR